MIVKAFESESFLMCSAREKPSISGISPSSTIEAVKKPLRFLLLKMDCSWLCSAHGRAKSEREAAFDPFGESPAAELAGGGRGALDRRGPSGACHLGVGRTFGPAPILRGYCEQRRGRRAAGVRSATVDQRVGVRLQPGNRLGAGSGAALRI